MLRGIAYSAPPRFRVVQPPKGNANIFPKVSFGSGAAIPYRADSGTDNRSRRAEGLVNELPRRALKPIVAYIRVSTSQQGRSGLGIEAQREALVRFAKGAGFEIVGEYVEVETGKGSDALDRRPQLAAALAKARALRSSVAVAKLDRLSRDVHFISGLMAHRVPFVVPSWGRTSTRSSCTSMRRSRKRSAR